MKPLVEDRVSYPALTREVIPESNWVRIRYVVMILLAMVVSLNLLVIGLINSAPISLDDRMVNLKWELARSGDIVADWVILGDSTANQGLDPRIAERDHERTAVNLATLANFGFVDDVWLLETYLENHPSPEAIIVMHAHDVYPREISLSHPVFDVTPLEFGAWHTSQLEFAPTLSDQSLWLGKRLFPLYFRNNTYLRALGRRAGLVQDTHIQATEITGDGFMVWPVARPSLLSREFEIQRDWLADVSFTVSDTNQRAFNTLIDMAASKAIPLHFVHAPIFDELYATPEFQTYLTDMRLWLQTQANQSTYFIYHPEVDTFPAEAMDYIDHVIYPYSDQLSEAIFARVAER